MGGRVEEASVGASDDREAPGLNACLFGAIEGMRFPEDSTEARVVYRF